MYNEYYYLAVQVAAAITALGLIFVLLRALFTPRKRKTVVVERNGGDQITVTTAAISSQAAHAIEQDDRFVAEKVRVQPKRGGKVAVNVRVRPRYTVDITREGKDLHDTAAQALAAICGEKVRNLNLEFVEAESPEPAQDVVVERIDDIQIPQAVFDRAEQAEALPSESSTEPEPEATYEHESLTSQDITVPMGGSSAHDGDDVADADVAADETIEGEVE